jgi:hypothetical protein
LDYKVPWVIKNDLEQELEPLLVIFRSKDYRPMYYKVVETKAKELFITYLHYEIPPSYHSGKDFNPKSFDILKTSSSTPYFNDKNTIIITKSVRKRVLKSLLFLIFYIFLNIRLSERRSTLWLMTFLSLGRLPRTSKSCYPYFSTITDVKNGRSITDCIERSGVLFSLFEILNTSNPPFTLYGLDCIGLITDN